GRPELPRLVEFAGIAVHGDDGGRPRQSGPGDGRVTDPAAADDRDRVPTADLPGVDRGADAGHDAATEQTRDLRPGPAVDLGALSGRHQGLLRERADPQGRGQFPPRRQGHLLRGVVGVETVLGLALAAGPALPAHRAPIQDHVITGGHLGHAVTDGLYDPRRFVTEQERELVVDPAFPVMQVGVAHPARLTRTTASPGPGSGMTMFST